MLVKKNIILLSLLVLVACSATQDESDFDSTLYSGKPVESLTNDEPPKSEEEAISRGDRALTNKNVDLALYEYIRSLAFPTAQYKDKTLYTIGRIHMAKGDFELADKAFRAALTENPNHIGSLEQLGTLYTKQGQKDVGKAYYLRALNADQVRLGSSTSVTKENLNQDTIPTLRFDGDSPKDAYVGLGVLCDLKGEHEIAQDLLRKALEIDAKNVHALVSLGYSYYMIEDYFRATHFTNAALSQNPGDERAINNLGLISIAKGKPRQALRIFAKHMSEAEALNNVGYFLILLDKPEEAIPYLQQAINKNPAYYEMANNNLERALAMVREGKNTSVAFLE